VLRIGASIKDEHPWNALVISDIVVLVPDINLMSSKALQPSKAALRDTAPFLRSIVTDSNERTCVNADAYVVRLGKSR
jgi:hypothetical protein